MRNAIAWKSVACSPRGANLLRRSRRPTALAAWILLILLAGCSGDDPLTPADPDCPVEAIVFPGGNVIDAQLIQSSHVGPTYPEQAAEQGIEGDVVLQGYVSSVGAVCDLRVVSVEPAGWGFDTAALEAVEQWRFEPAQRNGEAVAVYSTIYVEFRVHGAGVTAATRSI